LLVAIKLPEMVVSVRIVEPLTSKFCESCNPVSDVVAPLEVVTTLNPLTKTPADALISIVLLVDTSIYAPNTLSNSDFIIVNVGPLLSHILWKYTDLNPSYDPL
jgi:hypothetical protein